MRVSFVGALLLLAACKGEEMPVVTNEVEMTAVDAGRVLRTAMLSVAVTALRPGGKPWDPGDPLTVGKPDIAVCIHVDGRHRCYPGGKHISGPACRDSFYCDVQVEVPTTGEFEVEVWDADIAVHDLISKGACTLGERCHFSAATVVVTDATMATP